jgi:hypothetical protein
VDTGHSVSPHHNKGHLNPTLHRQCRILVKREKRCNVIIERREKEKTKRSKE